MQAAYADNATFSDTVFNDLNAVQVRAMWEMLLKSGGEIRVEFKNVKATDTNGNAEWTAWYTFSKTGRKVVNRIRAEFVFENGKIVSHKDHFNFHTWARQALGLPGLLFGGTAWLHNKIRTAAKGNLEKFMGR